MKTFINASITKEQTYKINISRVNKFIDKFNKFIARGGRFSTTDDNFSLNDALDKVPTLNPTEFKHAVKLAKSAGWILTTSPDNYQTTSYKMSKIK